jgi:hypothetical protein
VAQVVESLPRKHKALVQTPVLQKKKKKQMRERKEKRCSQKNNTRVYEKVLN